jgi:glycosyltransferase involved in cell wall biosynthesis
LAALSYPPFNPAHLLSTESTGSIVELTDHLTFSIITPSFNQGKFIKETIESVLNQEIEDLDYIICDGQSSDQTLDIISRYRGRLSWISEKDSGQAHAVNKGFSKTQGEIVGWLNSDDIYYPGTLRKVYDFFNTHPEVDFIYGKANYIDEQGVFLEHYPTEPWNYFSLIERCFICQPSVFFRRKLIKELGGLNEKLNYCLDYELWLRYCKASNVFYYEEFLSAFRLHKHTKTLSQRVHAHYELNDMIKGQIGHVPDIHIIRLALVKAEKQINCIPQDKIHQRNLPLKSQYFWVQLFKNTISEFFRCRKIPSIIVIVKIFISEIKKRVI